MKAVTISKRSFTLAAALVMLISLGLVSSPVAAQQGPTDQQSRFCILIGMLGGPLPPQCTEEADDEIDAEVQAQLDALRLATVAFHSFDVAQAAGWDFDLSGCVVSPMGGMGHHIANLSQLGNGGQLNFLRPEVLLYEPTEDGSMEFLGVEYVVPAEDWPFADPPVLLGQELDFLEGPGVWGLHVWIGRDNPEGIFAHWNPDVTCAFAGD